MSNKYLVRRNSNLLVGGNGTIEMVQRLQYGALLEEDVTLEPPWQGLGELVFSVYPGGHGEDVIQLFKCALLRLWDEQEDKHQSGKIKPSVEGESTDRVEHLEDTWERDGENGGPEEASGDGP